MLALISLLVLASVQLSSLELSSSKRNHAEQVARANARLALEIALSQLQLYTGRDQVTTCRADLIDGRDTPLSTADEGIDHPFYTLAFQTAPIDVDHDNYGKGVFLRVPKKLPACLVSSNEAFDLLSTKQKSYPDGYVTPWTRLDSDKSVAIATADNSITRVPLVQLPEIQNLSGNYAYWVADENLKARINLGNETEDTDSGLESTNLKIFNNIRAPSSVGRAHAGTDETAGFLDQLITPKKHITPASIAVLGELQTKGIQQTRSDFTTYSRSVLCDLKHGGLKKNFTAACALNDNEFIDLTNHTGKESSQASPVFLYQKWSFPSESENLSYSHYPGSPWELFRSYLRRPEFEPNLTGEQPAVLSHLGNSAHKLDHYWQHTDKSYIPPLSARLVRRSPVLLRLQVGIDYSINYSGLIIDAPTNSQWHQFELRQHFLPQISYWNPYNVDLFVSEPIDYHIYLDRNWSSGSHDTMMRMHFPENTHWKYSTPLTDQWIDKVGTESLTYPFHHRESSAPKTELSRCSFHIPPFSLEAGKTTLFQAPDNNRLLRYKKSQMNQLEPITDKLRSGNSFYSKNMTLRVSAESTPDYQSAIPELEILRYPAEGGRKNTRLHVTNASSFQRINWNFASVSEKSALRFTPTLVSDSEALPQSDSNGTHSPKFTGVVIRKSPHIDHYQPQNVHWKTTQGSINSNAYTAPWSLFYQSNASRYGAFGAKAGEATSFSSPPQYLTGIILGSSQLLQTDLTSDGQSFVGYSDTFASGTNKSVQIAIPRHETRCFSPAHLNQINTSKWLSNYNADQSNASATDALTADFSIGNSFCSPHIPPQKTSATVYDKNAYSSDLTSSHYDTSFRYNDALWDRYFFTGLRDGESASVKELKENIPSKHLSILQGADIDSLTCPHRSASKYLLEGGFNINSTSVEAWKTVLGSTVGKQTANSEISCELTPFPRLQYSKGSAYSTPPTDPTDKSYYSGESYRALTKDEITTLAENIVIQNKLRGPYATLAQFVNRSLSPTHHYRHIDSVATIDRDAVCYEGPIQAAINASNINGAFLKDNSNYPEELEADEDIVADYEAGKINPKALKYHTGYGSPGTLTQSDILYRIGHMLTARSDTFIIRAYGDCRDFSGEILARSYCEAVVQRLPDYVSSEVPSETPPNVWKLNAKEPLPINGSSAPNQNLTNISKKLGRRYVIVQFRWLNPKEI